MLSRQLAPAELPRVSEIGIDAAVLAFALLISVLSGTWFGAIAVVKFWRPQALTLKDGGRAGGISPARHRPRHILAVSEVALAMTLLVVSGLMIRTFVAMRQVQPGFTRPQNVQTFRVAIPPRLLTDPEQVARVVRVAVRRGDDGAADVCGDIACFGSGATACDLRPRATGVPRRSGRCAARRRLALIDVIGHVCPDT